MIKFEFAFPSAELFQYHRFKEDLMSKVPLPMDHAEWLSRFVEAHGGVSGTIHLLEGEILTLSAALNIPPHVRKLVEEIPRGRAWLGVAWERDEPALTCNLKEDNSGNVQPRCQGGECRFRG